MERNINMANEIIKGMGFHHIALKCKDLDKSVQMYMALGMKEVRRWVEKSGSRAVMLDVGDGGRIEMFSGGNDEYSAKGKWLHFAMKVDDVDAAFAVARAAGFAEHIAPKDVVMETSIPAGMAMRIAFVVGNDGELLELFKEA